MRLAFGSGHGVGVGVEVPADHLEFVVSALVPRCGGAISNFKRKFDHTSFLMSGDANYCFHTRTHGFPD